MGWYRYDILCGGPLRSLCRGLFDRGRGASQERPAGELAAGGGGDGPHCVSEPLTGVIPAENGHSGQWYVLNCGSTLPQGSFGGTPLTGPPLWADVDAAPSSAPMADPAVAAAKAVAQLQPPKPAVRLSPRTDGPQVVRVPTWMWLDQGQWQPVRATADVPGVSVVAVAKPSSVVWEAGDGATVTCDGPGTPYSRGADPASASPDCGHTYLHSSEVEPGGVFKMTATVHWSVSWSGGGEWGVPGPDDHFDRPGAGRGSPEPGDQVGDAGDVRSSSSNEQRGVRW